jgi:uncharacterized protein (TIGR04141 family)
MAKKKPRHHSLSIYLIKEGVSDVEEIIPNLNKLHEHQISIGRKRLGTLYVKHTPGHLPAWFDFLTEHIDEKLTSQFKIKNVSAVLLLTHEERLFALCFGHGHQLLDEESIVNDFGLKATLNSISPDAVRQLDRRRLDSTGRIASEQAGQEIPIRQFGLDIEQDLLRRVSARPIDPALGLQMSGRDSLRVAIPAKVGDIREYLGRYLAKSREQTYKENFEFIDNIEEVISESLCIALNTQVIEAINSEEYRNVWMAPPDLLDWDDIRGFRYTKDQNEDPRLDIDLDSFRMYCADGGDITWDMLRSKHIHVCDVNGDPVKQWLAYKCVYAELPYNRNVYVLTEGKWYRIDTDFAQKINRSFESIHDSDLQLPVWAQRREDEYNQHVAETSNGYFQLLDKKTVQYPGGHNKIEFCDLLSRDRHLVHVKKFTSSSGLSHLCEQGVNSAEYTRQDRAFREKVNAKMRELHIPDEFHLPLEFDAEYAGNYEVVFGIATKNAHIPLEIPFFSKVSMYHATRRCQGLGYKVSKLKIIRNDLAE